MRLHDYSVLAKPLVKVMGTSELACSINKNVRWPPSHIIAISINKDMAQSQLKFSDCLPLAGSYLHQHNIIKESHISSTSHPGVFK